MNEKDANWYAGKYEAKSEPIIDEGTGKVLVLRHFDFKIPQLPKGTKIATKEEILKVHKSKIIAFLWKDELELVEDMRIFWTRELPKGNFKKEMKFLKIDYVVFALCQAKKGSLIFGKPQLLQDIFNATPTNTK